MATVRISGNWRNPNKMEWGGAPEIDDDGHIERSVKIPEAIYLAIEEYIQKGQVQGSIATPDGTRYDWFLDR
jgi:hypothetical protein